MGLKRYIKRAVDSSNEILDSFPIKKKLYYLYIMCIIIPIVILDSVFLSNLANSEVKRQENEMANIAQAVQYNLTKTIDDAVFITKDYYLNEKISVFLNEQYSSPYVYFENFQKLKDNSIFDVSLVGRNATLKIYADNDSIIDGSEFGSLSMVENQKWCKYYQEHNRDLVVYPYVSYDRPEAPTRNICVIRRLNYYGGCEKIMKLNIDYSVIENALLNSKYAVPVYVCSGKTILYANRGNTSTSAEFGTLSLKDLEDVGYTQSVSFYTQDWNIYVMRPQSSVISMLQNNISLILTMLALSIFVPILFMYSFNRSFTQRLGELSRHFSSIDKNGDTLKPIGSVRGKDEIADLMQDYNQMVRRINDLIQVVYKGKLKEQEADIARQNAEVLALQSQINPHFLFNALESIRMHSVLKHEEETAEMICKLSVMMRQSVDWGQDVVTVAEEVQFAEAYLQLQKYRFGEQLSYKISVAPECRNCYIPKLTIVTFTENACVHGIEGKSGPGWIFIEVSRSGDNVVLEVEDTGIGMPPDKLRALQESMQNASIRRLHQGGRVGVVNACFRLRAFTGGRACFQVESEEKVGCTVTIHLPVDCTRRRTYPSADSEETSG